MLEKAQESPQSLHFDEPFREKSNVFKTQLLIVRDNKSDVVSELEQLFFILFIILTEAQYFLSSCMTAGHVVTVCVHHKSQEVFLLSENWGRFVLILLCWVLADLLNRVHNVIDCFFDWFYHIFIPIAYIPEGLFFLRAQNVLRGVVLENVVAGSVEADPWIEGCHWFCNLRHTCSPLGH